MLRAIQKMIRRYGCAMVLCNSKGEHPIRAFLQETRSKSLDSIRRETAPLGEIPKGTYVYIGPADPAAQPGDTLQFQGKTYEFRRAELICARDSELYCWGLCVRKGSEGIWGD